MRSLTRQEVRRIDQTAIEVLGVAGLVLMENAGRSATDVIEEFCRTPPNVLRIRLDVFCGTR